MVLIFATKEEDIEGFPTGKEDVLCTVLEGENLQRTVEETLRRAEAKQGDIFLFLGRGKRVQEESTEDGSTFFTERERPGTWFQLHAMEGMERSFYPEMLYRSGFPEGRAVADRNPRALSPILKGRGEAVFLERLSAQLFPIANQFLATEDLFFLCKEEGHAESLQSFGKMESSESAEERGPLRRFLQFLLKLNKKRAREKEKEESFLSEVQQLSKELHLSFSLEKKLEKFLRYADTLSLSWKAYFQALRNAKALPVHDKRSGQKVLSDFSNWLLQEESEERAARAEQREKSGAVLKRDENSPAEAGDKEEIFPFYPPFSHIYIEEALLRDRESLRVLERFPKAVCIPIRHYKDVFNRKKQNRSLQEKSRKLILARKEGQRIYKGAPVCQDFSEAHFYYSSLLMNCPFHCAYCYLQGMYPSANLVLFLNLNDYFTDCRALLSEKGSLYLCISYDTDLIAMEEVYPYVERFLSFLEEEKKLLIEVRTKAGGEGFFRRIETLSVPEDVKRRMIFAFTLSPPEIVEEAEQGSAGLMGRIVAVKRAIEEGFRVRLCFDPMIYHADWKNIYRRFLTLVFREIPSEKVYDISVGSFRISESYLKAMERACPDSPHTFFPYENTNGFYHYPKALLEEMEGFLLSRIEEQFPKERIFRWKDE
jgi:spore photoproduct